MTNDNKLSVLRNMANKPVENTFQGILRVSNYKELQNNIPDNFLNSIYYGVDNSATWKDSEQNTHDAYYGNISRFVKGKDADKSYRNLKLPVTDSRGYFLNLFLGEADSTIGIDSAIGEINSTGSKYFPIIKTNYLKIGTIPTEIDDTVNADSVSLNIISDAQIAKLAIHSSHYHNNDALVQKPSNSDYQTIFIDDNKAEPSLYDAFIYRQEYIDKNASGDRKHAYVRIENIKDYIQKRLDSYFEMNVKEVPTGMIIYHYSSLKNWYCPTSSYTDSKDISSNYAGYRPSLYKKELSQNKNDFSAYNTVQGVSNGEPHLRWGDTVLDEIVPEYKRDYALCDGRAYEIAAAPSFKAGKTYTDSFARFYKLFHCLGYFYTDSKTICAQGHYKNTKSGNNYQLPTTLDKIPDTDVNKDQLYEISMAVCNAFIALNYAIQTPAIYDKEIKGSNGLYDRAKAEKWLSGKKFNEITGCMYFESSKKSSSYNGVTIGTKVSSFSDTINYYYYNSNTKTNVNVAIYKTAEVQKMLDLFAEPAGTLEQKFSNIFKYSFNVPKLYTTSDPEITYIFGDKKYGLFIGSNGLITASVVEDVKNNFTYTPISVPFVQNVTCNFNPGHYPHTHATSASPRNFNDYKNAFIKFKPDDNQHSVDKNSIISSNYIGNNNLDITSDGNNFSASNVHSQNYFINQVINPTKKELYNEQIVGVPGDEFAFGTCNWYGRTSGPVNISSITTSLNSNKSTWTTEYIFRPENIRMLPLIKL